MIKEAVICDFCYGSRIKVAQAKCFLCKKDICNEHNWGAFDRSKLALGVSILGVGTVNVWQSKSGIIDVCSDCLKYIRDDRVSFEIPEGMFEQLEAAFEQWKISVAELK